MNTSTKIITTLLSVMILTSLAYAKEDPQPNELPAEKPAQSLVLLDAEAAAKLRPLPFALREVLLNERSQLEILHARHAEATGAIQRLEIQKEIELVKNDTEISLVNVQIDHAKLEGRTEDVENLENALHRMTTAPEDRIQAPSTSR